MKEKRGILGGEKDNMVKSQPKKGLRCKGCNSVLLIPARTDTQWFKKLIKHNVAIWFIEGRLHFNDQGPAPFPSMLVEISSFIKNTKYSYIEKKDFNYFFD